MTCAAGGIPSDMSVSATVWILTVAVIAGLALFDYAFHVRKAHRQTLGDAAIWSGLYVSVGIVFGLGVMVLAGTPSGVEYFAGYLINEALSVDNLFVLLIVVTSFAVPRFAQQKVSPLRHHLRVDRQDGVHLHRCCTRRGIRRGVLPVQRGSFHYGGKPSQTVTIRRGRS